MLSRNLNAFVPDIETAIAFEPEELGLHLLSVFASWPPHMSLELHVAIGEICGAKSYGSSARSGGAYPGQLANNLEIALREAWAWLEGAALLIPHPGYVGAHTVRMMSRKAVEIGREQSPKLHLQARRLPKEMLHPAIRDDAWSLFHRRKYDTAVFEAMKAVEVAVRDASGLKDKMGVDLMRSAFHHENGPLTDMAMPDSERQARSALFAGAIGSFKNPHSHRNVALDNPEEAAEILLLASHLLRIVGASRSDLR